MEQMYLATRIVIALSIISSYCAGQSPIARNIASNIRGSISNIFSFESECATVGTDWSLREAVTASGELLTVSEIVESIGSPPTNASSHIVWNIDIPSADNYNIYVRNKAPAPSDDSFWIRANGGSWTLYNPGATETVFGIVVIPFTQVQEDICNQYQNNTQTGYCQTFFSPTLTIKTLFLPL